MRSPWLRYNPSLSAFLLTLVPCPLLSALLQPGETAILAVSFAATVEGAKDLNVPLYLDGGKTPYLTPRFLANAVPPRLTFDRPELVLPTVPLGHTAKVSQRPERPIAVPPSSIHLACVLTDPAPLFICSGVALRHQRGLRQPLHQGQDAR